MRTIETTADKLLVGDTITSIDGATLRNEELVLTLTAAWTEDGRWLNHSDFGRLIMNDALVTFNRPETTQERQAVARKAYDRLLLRLHSEGYILPNEKLEEDLMQLMWTMYLRKGDMGEAFRQEIQEALEGDYDYRCTVPPC